jgi:hypothetical protein
MLLYVKFPYWASVSAFLGDFQGKKIEKWVNEEILNKNC